MTVIHRPEEFRVFGGHLLLDRDAERLQGGFSEGTRRQSGPQGIGPTIDSELQDVLFGRKVAVEGPRRDLGRRCDVLHRDLREPALLEEPQRDVLQFGQHHLRTPHS